MLPTLLRASDVRRTGTRNDMQPLQVNLGLFLGLLACAVLSGASAGVFAPPTSTADSSASSDTIGATATVASSPSLGATSSPAATSPSPADTPLSPAATSAAPADNSSESGPVASSTPAAPPTPGSAPTETTTTLPEEEEDDCMDQFEYANNPELLERLKKYDVAKVLEELGGAPGKVNATWKDKADVPESEALHDADLAYLADNDNSTYWLYNYGSTDYKKYIRTEHALLRAKGTPGEYVDIRGEVWWAPEDLCGGLRHARYRQDNQGFVAEVLRAHCQIFSKSQSLSCFGPDSENPCAFCISGVSGALIASLVG